jgi:hypothetical protein
VRGAGDWGGLPVLTARLLLSKYPDIGEIGSAEQVAAGLVAHYWPPEAASLPWVTAVYPEADRGRGVLRNAGITHSGRVDLVLFSLIRGDRTPDDSRVTK